MFDLLARIEARLIELRENTPELLGQLDDFVSAVQRIAHAAERIADVIAPAHPSEGGVIEATRPNVENEQRHP